MNCNISENDVFIMELKDLLVISEYIEYSTINKEKYRKKLKKIIKKLKTNPEEVLNERSVLID